MFTPFSNPGQTGSAVDYPTPSIVLSPGRTAGIIVSDTELNPVQKMIAMTVMKEADQHNPGFGFTTGDLVRASVGAGLGAATGKIIGAVAGMNPHAQKRLTQVGALGGLLRATGVWR